jgi:hypothetical protein
MARYFFHVIDGKFLVDEEGTECLGLTQVREQAIATAGAILRDYAPNFPSGVEWQMHVTDEDNTAVFKLRFSMEETAPLAAPKLAVV